MEVDEGEQVAAWAWGNGLAFGELQHVVTPAKLPVRGRSLKAFAAACEQVFLVTQNGALWAAGPNRCRWLFEEGSEETRPPERVDLPELEGNRVEAVAGGQEHVIAILEDGQRVLSWGQSNEFGQLGHGSPRLSKVPPRAVLLPLPRVQVRQVACGELHTLVLTVAGTLFAFGDGSHGALGLSTRTSTPQPTLVEEGDVRGMPLRSIAAGAQHSMALSLGGFVFAWGNARHGRLGLGPAVGEVVAYPTMVPCPQEHARFISAGGRHSAVILHRGLCFVAGDNQHGQLGLNPTNLPSSDSFIPLEGKWRVAALGSLHSLFLSYDGSLHSCGHNDAGQLGSDGDAAPSKTLREVRLPPGEAVVGLAAGPDHCVALTTPMKVLRQPKRTTSLGEAQLRVDVQQIARVGSEGGVARRPPEPTHSLQLPMVVEGDEGQDGEDEEPLKRSNAHTGPWERPGTAPAARGLVAEEEELPRTLSGGCRHTLSKELKVKLVPLAESQRSSLETLLRPMAWPGVCTSAKFAGLDVPTLQRLVDGLRAGATEELRRSLSAVLSQPSLLNASFCFPGLRRPRVDAAGLMQSFSALWESGTVAGRLESQLREAASQGLRRWAGDPAQWADIPPPLRHRDQVRGLATLLLCPLVAQTDSSHQSFALMEQLVSLIVSLPSDGRTAFVNVVMEEMIPVLRPALVPNLRRFCNAAVRKGAHMRHMGPAVWNGLLVLDLLAFANQSFQKQLRTEVTLDSHEDLPRTISRVLARAHSATEHGLVEPQPSTVAAPVPVTDFQLEVLAEDVVPPDVEFALFMQNAQTHIPSTAEVLTLRPDDERLHSFMVHRKLLPAAFVRRVLQRENLFRQHLRQQQSLQDVLRSALMGQNAMGPFSLINVDPSQMFFILSVRRDHLLEDTVQALQAAAPADLQRQIKIVFNGEEGQDAGGVSREFFRLIGDELFSLQSRLFSAAVAEEARVLWFDRSSTRDTKDFWLVGVIVGLAVYNNLPGLDVRFPVCAFKKLRGEAMGLEDLAEVQPSVAGSLRSLLSWQPPQGVDVAGAAELFESVFGLNFTLSYEEAGTAKVHELKERGSETPVTLASREDFVRLYCQWTLETSIEAQFEPFRRGFSHICDSPLFHALTGAELAQIVMGEADLQLEDLKPGAKYEGFSADSEYIAGLWEILRSFDVPQQQRFLAFVTGSNRAPVGGLKELQLRVQKNGTEDERLPLAHTCFNLLLLPEYSSQQRLREALLTAIENSEGFGLQ